MVELPDDRTTVVQPVRAAASDDPPGLLREALRRPLAGPRLRDMVSPGQTVAIAVCDGTRAQPRNLMLPRVLEELEGIVRLEDVVVLIATGTHRGNTEQELRAMLGGEIVDNVRVINHDARDSASLRWMGRHGDGVPVWLNRFWVEADIRVTTGFVEPHFFAGFSGGPKLAVPGLAGLETVLTLHDSARIGHPKATWGVCEGNPVHDDIRAVVGAVGGVDFAFDVILNDEQHIVAAFAGELFAMHAAARAAARAIAMRPVPYEFDVVVTTNSGFPLDQNLYQTVKGMSAANLITKEGGTIICAAECRDGFPDHGSYKDLLVSAPTPRDLLRKIHDAPETLPDQWQVQVQAKIQTRVRVIMSTTHLSNEALAAVHLEQTDDIGATVRTILNSAGSAARVCVLPEGPQTIPYVVSAG